MRHLRLRAWARSRSNCLRRDNFVIVDAAALGFAIRVDEARNLAETGVCVIAAANDQLGFTHLEVTGWDHISSVSSPGPLTCEGNELEGSKAVAVCSGKIDCSARRGLQRSHGHFERARAHGGG